MQPHSHLLGTYRTIVDRVIQTVDGAFQRSDADAGKRGPGIFRSKNAWRPIPALLAEIDAALPAYGEAVVKAATNTDLSEAGQNDRIAQATARYTAIITNATAEVLTTVDAILDGLRRDAYPARPTGDVAAQEATLAGLKSDHRMVLDAVGGDRDVVTAIKERLSRAIGDGDALGTWLLASSSWPRDYLSSRGLSIYAATWDQEVGQLLDASGTSELADTRRVYAALSDGQSGLPVLNVLFTSLLMPVIDEIGSFRLGRVSGSEWMQSLRPANAA